MTVPLRERRRRETAREIQLATLRLAAERGLERVTTEAIAEAVGISPRTFFNYYTNKESASVGHPPGFSEEDCRNLRDGTGTVGDDLKKFLDAHAKHLGWSEEVIRHLGPVMTESGKVRAILDQHMRDLTADLAACLQARPPGMAPEIAQELAGWALQGMGSAVGEWLAGTHPSLPAALDALWPIRIAALRKLL
ncbi:TetR/AcrR family transcriptional regulator [Mangrovicoccus algicola]|uniref:TetR/AcrR family transcriptional regulator n=1 Tax=Mangrovicoccus algicola TaxID=2771008 RepID=A0A8J7D071_9RHOB|nr:TetR/AcrR family transcriptional regulator [Mangrovicoccus algicola]MBE3639043.1 TetR/AcrR family transcriptional regulator [Mangrovicoccus algicola]